MYLPQMDSCSLTLPLIWNLLHFRAHTANTNFCGSFLHYHQSCGAPLKDTAAPFYWSCIKMGQYFFHSQLVFDGSVPRRVGQTWTPQLGEHRWGGQRGAVREPPTCSLPNFCALDSFVCKQTYTEKKFSKHTWVSQVHWCVLIYKISNSNSIDSLWLWVRECLTLFLVHY